LFVSNIAGVSSSAKWGHWETINQLTYFLNHSINTKFNLNKTLQSSHFNKTSYKYINVLWRRIQERISYGQNGGSCFWL